jgi:DNA-binding CsgD family transcriptional regulator
VTHSSEQTRPDRLLGLTAKQCEVLDLLIEHQTSKEISRKLGISPHTVDQRIMLARAKLNVGTRSEVAQAYRRLLHEQRETAPPAPYEQPIYGSPDMAAAASAGHSVWREGAGSVPSGGYFPGSVATVSAPQPKAQAQAIDQARSYYHVLPEAFDGQIGTLMRLGAIAAITDFLTLVILGGLAIYSELSHLVDG